MRQGRRTIESRNSLIIAALVACCCLPAISSAQNDARRTIIIKQPTGWFGVRISDQAMMDPEGNAFFDSYPIVTQVDPNSPAARAGVMPGDVLLTFNSHDMRGGSMELSKWLKEGAPFVLKIRRNDVTRMLRGRLARRPDNWDPNVVYSITIPERLQQRTGSLSRSVEGTMQVRTRVPTPEPLPTVLAPALGYGGGVYPFAGAEFTRLNADLCDALGVQRREGVFVTNVLDGSVARTAGLRGGDIIVRADGVKIDDPIDLVRVISAADERDRTVSLQIMRRDRLQALTLRW